LRSVRSAVLLGDQGRRKQVLLMTSAVPGDGKTTFSVNFAITLAIAGHRVLLVDADLRRGDTHNFFNHARDPGLADVLLGQQHWSDVIQETPVKTLDVIHSGHLPPNPGELLISPITRAFVEEAKRTYDFVLFDCPPLTTIDDSFALVGLVDGLIFVVRSGQTSMRFAKAALDAVRKREATILGFVLNGIKSDNPYYYYKHYYHSYYTPDQPRSHRVEATPQPARIMARPRRAAAADGSRTPRAERGMPKGDTAAVDPATQVPTPNVEGGTGQIVQLPPPLESGDHPDQAGPQSAVG
jgi:capsular exopolysaccharide synthesis family protein